MTVTARNVYACLGIIHFKPPITTKMPLLATSFVLNMSNDTDIHMKLHIIHLLYPGGQLPELLGGVHLGHALLLEVQLPLNVALLGLRGRPLRRCLLLQP
eukprot:scaffold53827_cov46-Prasinocladus_malaysianus.AAC.2